MWNSSASHTKAGRLVTMIVRLAIVSGLTVATATMLGGCRIPQIQISQATPAPSGPGVTVPVRVEQGQGGATLLVISVSIAGRGPFPFALDTGASTSLIDRTLAQKLDLPVTGRPQPISGVGGTDQAVPVAVKQWNAGPLRLPPATIGSASIGSIRQDAGIDGLLGSDILSRFGRITIDYAAGTLTVYQQVAYTSSSSYPVLAGISTSAQTRQDWPARNRLALARTTRGL